MPSVVRQIHHTIPLLKEKEKEESLHSNFLAGMANAKKFNCSSPSSDGNHLDYVLPLAILRILSHHYYVCLFFSFCSIYHISQFCFLLAGLKFISVFKPQITS